jgi:hypothetical protein
MLSSFSKAFSKPGSFSDPSLTLGYDLGAGRGPSDTGKAFCRANRRMDLSIFQPPSENEAIRRKNMFFDDSCFLQEAKSLGSINSHQDTGSEPAGWLGNNITFMNLGGPMKSFDSSFTDAYTVLNINWTENRKQMGKVPDGPGDPTGGKYNRDLMNSQYWRQREPFPFVSTWLMIALISVLSFFIALLECINSFVPEYHHIKETCDLKTILRNVFIRIFCPCMVSIVKRIEGEAADAAPGESADATKVVPKPEPGESTGDDDDEAKDEGVVSAIATAAKEAAVDSLKDSAKGAAKGAALNMIANATGVSSFATEGGEEDEDEDEDEDEGGSHMKKALDAFDTFFVYFLVNLPFNFLVAW